MKIDAHQHFWKYDPTKHTWITEELGVLKKDFLPEQLRPLLEEHSFDGCIAVQAEQSEGETDFLLGLASKSDFIKGVVGWLDLEDETLEGRLQHYSSFPKFKGVRHIVQDEPDVNFLLRDSFMRGVRMLDKYALTYDILVFTKQLPATVEFVKQFPDQPFVLDHIAKPQIAESLLSNWEPHIRNIARHENVYCKLSGMVTEASWTSWKKDDFKVYLDVVFEAFGTKRLMVGSDWPVCLLATDYEGVVGIVEDYISGLSETEQSDIMGNNASEFYKL